MIDIISLAYRLTDSVAAFASHSRRFFYAVTLMAHDCPKCGGTLQMAREGRCRCRACAHEFDPTLQFQRCTACGRAPILRIRRYQCRQCGTDMASHFLFEGIVFNADYFRQKMAEHRERRKELKERVRLMLKECRSQPVEMVETIDLGSVPGLTDALNGLTAYAHSAMSVETRDGFDLKRYERHVGAHLEDSAVSLEDIPPLIDDARRDRIWRFVALLYLATARLVDIWQEGETIMVRKHEIDGEGQDVFGSAEDPDGVERPLGRVEA